MWTDICFFRAFAVLDRPAHAQTGPGILMEGADVEVFVARLVDDLLIVQRRTGPDGIDPTRLVVLVP